MPKVTLTAHNGFLIIETKDPELSHEDWHQNGLGCVISNTDINLGISKEAIGLLKEIKAGTDDLGDIVWFQSYNAGSVFTWIGTPQTIYHPSEIEGSVDYNPSKFIEDKAFVEIENNISSMAKTTVEEIQHQALDDSPGG